MSDQTNAPPQQFRVAAADAAEAEATATTAFTAFAALYNLLQEKRIRCCCSQRAQLVAAKQRKQR